MDGNKGNNRDASEQKSYVYAILRVWHSSTYSNLLTCLCQSISGTQYFASLNIYCQICAANAATEATSILLNIYYSKLVHFHDLVSVSLAGASYDMMGSKEARG